MEETKGVKEWAEAWRYEWVWVSWELKRRPAEKCFGWHLGVKLVSYYGVR